MNLAILKFTTSFQRFFCHSIVLQLIRSSLEHREVTWLKPADMMTEFPSSFYSRVEAHAHM